MNHIHSPYGAGNVKNGIAAMILNINSIGMRYSLSTTRFFRLYMMMMVVVVSYVSSDTVAFPTACDLDENSMALLAIV